MYLPRPHLPSLALLGLLAVSAPPTARAQGVFVDRFLDGVPTKIDGQSFWTVVNSTTSSGAAELYGQLKLHAENAAPGIEAHVSLLSAPRWEGNFIQSEKVYSVRGIELGSHGSNMGPAAFVFALNSAQRREDDPGVATDAISLRLDRAGNRVRLAWKLDASGAPGNVLAEYDAPSLVHSFVLRLSSTGYHLTVFHETGQRVSTGTFPANWIPGKWDNQGDASMVIRGIRKANTSGVIATDVYASIIDVGGATLCEPFSDATPANIGSYWPNFWTSSLTGSGGSITETAGNLVLRAGAGTDTRTFLADVPSLEYGNFIRRPKTYALSGINLAGDTASAGNREFVFALNSRSAAEDATDIASDAIRLRLGGDNNVKLEWKLNAVGAPANTFVNQTLNGRITDARLTLDRWRYGLAVTTTAGPATFSGRFNPLSWNPADWNDVNGANNGNAALLLRANKTGASGTYAQASLASAAIYAPAFVSEFEGATPEADGWILERFVPTDPTDTTPRLALSTARSLSGNQSVRFEVQRKDPNVSSGKRSEVVRHKVGGQGQERWYSFSVFLEGWERSLYGEIIAQWIQESDVDVLDTTGTVIRDDEPAIGPTLTIGIIDDKWTIDSRYDERFITPAGQKQMNALNLYTSGRGAVEKNQWVDFVVRVKWSTQKDNPDGIIQVWKNGVLIANTTRPNFYNNLGDVYFKAGIYRYSWNTTKLPTDVSQRVLYLDAVKMADETIGLAGMRPR